MKKCNKCQEVKSTSEFNKNGGGFQRYCRECDRVASKARYHANKQDHIAAVALNRVRYVQRNREYVLEYLRTHPCVDCGNADIRVLEFDHVRGDKVRNISLLMGGGFSLKKIQEEIAKCDVRCANCHRIITAERGGFWRTLAHTGVVP